MYGMRFDYNFYYYDSSDYYPYLYLCLYNVSADVPSGLLQVPLFELGSLLVVIGICHGTSKPTLYSIHRGYSALVPLFIAGYKC